MYRSSAMKKLTVLIASLAFVLLSVNAHAHGFQNKRLGSYIGYSNSSPYLSHYSSHYSSRSSSHYYPSNSLILGISYRNYNSRIGLQNRIYNGRVSNNRTYNNGYRNSYRDSYRNSYSDGYRNNRRGFNNNDYRNTCYESYYDRYGNRVERSLPASACRH